LLPGDGKLLSDQNQVIRNIPSQKYTVTLQTEASPITVNGSLPTYGAILTQLNQFANYASYAAIFDRYCIHDVRIEFIPSGKQIITNSAVAVPRFYTAVDFDDATTPTSIADVQKYDTLVGVPFTAGLVRHYVPRVAIQVYNGVTPGYKEAEASTWLDLANPDIPHYGLRYAYGPGDTSLQYVPVSRITVSFAGRR